MDNSEAIGTAVTENFIPKRVPVAHPPLPKLFRERNRVAVQIDYQASHAITLHGAESAARRDHEPRGRVSGVEFTVKDFVPHRGPADFAV